MPDKERVIFHVDCNAFYASVEETLHPELKKVPMAVCGDPENRRGIILAKNELAKGFGVKTAETIWQAKQKCPGLVFAPPRHPLYREYCEKVNAIYEKYTDQVERFGIDESYLDVTGSLHLFGGRAEVLAHEIRQRIPRETGLTVSVGVSFNKTFAKLGSDYKKPNAVTVISRENYREVVWPLPASALLFVGKTTAQHLAQMNIHTIGDLARTDEAWLRTSLGKMGESLYLHANGLDDSPVAHVGDQSAVQSIGHGMTFRRNLLTDADIKTAVTALSDSVARRMRRDGVKCMTVQVTIKDTDLKVITRQKATQRPTHLAGDLVGISVELIKESWKPNIPIRMLTITAMRLIPEDEVVEQISFFDERSIVERSDKRERLEKTMDAIRDKFGAQSIQPGSIVSDDLGIHQTSGLRIQEEKRMDKKTCCFSGHRPEGLPGGGNEETAEAHALKSALHRSIEQAVRAGYTHFISGMSRGIDFWAAEHILFLQGGNSALTLEAAVPCAAQADRWSPDDRLRYESILQRAHEVTQVQFRYTSNCFQKRNQYMVDKSSLLIAVWNGRPSGTGNCVRYAKKKGIHVEILKVIY